jgi:hypothetical protein
VRRVNFIIVNVEISLKECLLTVPLGYGQGLTLIASGA